MEQNFAEYTARNMYEAAYFYSRGIELVTVLADEGRATRFVFSNKDGQAEKAARDYRNDAEAPVKTVFEALRALKAEADRARGRPPL